MHYAILCDSKSRYSDTLLLLLMLVSIKVRWIASHPLPTTQYFIFNTVLSQWGSLTIATGLKSLDLTWKIFQIVGWYEPDTNWSFLLLWLTEQKQVNRPDGTPDQAEERKTQLRTQLRRSGLTSLAGLVNREQCDTVRRTKEKQKMWAASGSVVKSPD